MQKLTAILFLSLGLLSFSVFGQTRKAQKVVKTSIVYAPETVEQKIVRYAVTYHLDPRLFQSLIYAESTFNPSARSGKGAGCLTQLMPPTARRFGLVVNSQIDERFSNVDKCLNAGAYYLAWLLSTFHGDVRLALAGYNAGEGAVMKFGNRIPPYRETTQYVEKICALYYGQYGHGVAMAYNQPLAQSFVNDLYRNWRVRRIGTASPSAAPQIPDSNSDDPVRISVEPNAAEESRAKLANKKPGVTRVQLEPPTTRLRTQSLSFY